MSVSRRSPWIMAAAVAFALAGCGSDEDKTRSTDDGGPSITDFRASAQSVPPGGHVTLSWIVENAPRLRIEAEPGTWQLDRRSGEPSGSAESDPLAEATTFTLTLIGQDDMPLTGADGQPVRRTLQVDVHASELEIARFVAVPNPARLGSTTTLQWETIGALTLRIFKGTTQLYSAPPSAIAEGSFPTPVLTERSTELTLVASNDGDTEMKSITVLAEEQPFILTFDVSPRTFTGTSTTVTARWETANASTLELLANGTPLPGFAPASTSSGAVSLTISETTTFELVAKSGGGEARAGVTVSRTTAELEPNDTATTAVPIPSGATVGALDVGDVDYFAVAVPEGGYIAASISDGAEGCPISATLRLFAPDGTTEIGAFPGFQTLVCPALDPSREPTLRNLAPGTYFLAVEGVDGGVGPYVLSVVTGTPACGNGIHEWGESCDDGNGVEDDTCSNACMRIVAATVPAGGGAITVALAAGESALVQVDTTTTGQSLEVVTTDPSGACTLDTRLELSTVDLDFVGESRSDGLSPCAALRPRRDSFAAKLPVGTYFLTVVNEGQAAGEVRVDVKLIDPGCGNSVIDRGERCDDGNVTPGDGCSATCAFEALGTVSGPPGDGTFAGALAGEVDAYQVVLTAPGYISAETFSPTAPGCDADADTILTVTNVDFSETLAVNDDAADSRCSRVEPQRGRLLPAGTYWVLVSGYHNQAIAAYELVVHLIAVGCGNGVVDPGETCDDANRAAEDGCNAMCQFEGDFTLEVEPNGAPDGTATPSHAERGRTVELQGSISMPGDVDFFAFDVAGAPATLTAATGTSPLDPSLCEGSIDTVLTLYDGTGATLASNDDVRRGFRCSRLNPQTTPALGALAPGRYYLEVRHYTPDGLIPAYFLSVTLE